MQKEAYLYCRSEREPGSFLKWKGVEKLAKDPIKLEYKMNKGEEYIYQITLDSEQRIEVEGKPQEVKDHLIMKMLQRVADVNKDGSYNLEMVVEPQQLVRNGENMPMQGGEQRVTMKMNKNGEILETSMPSPASQPSFPTKPLVVGEKWTGESKINLGKPEPAILKFNYLLWGVEQTKGYECAIIQVNSPETEIPLDGGNVQKISANGTTFFAHQEGRLVKSEVNTKIFMEAPQGKLSNVIKILVALTDAPKARTSPSAILGGPPDDFIIR